jgi:hypothetical protein
MVWSRALALVTTVTVAGCSLVHAKQDNPSCSFEHPNTDAVMAGIFAGLAATLIVAETKQDNRDAPVDKAVFATGYVLLLPAAVFAVSATVGFRSVVKCRQD